MAWTMLRFGKHAGETLPQVLFRDPDWFFWAVENGIFENKGGPIIDQVKELTRKATHIKIPNNNNGDLVVEYVIHPPTGKLARINIVRSEPRRNPNTFRIEVIDLSIPHKIGTYDKMGGRIMIKSIKSILFGNASYIITKKRCENFFNNPNNFINI